MTQNRRYPGAKPFTRAQEPLFKGRNHEVERLHQLVSLESLTLMHGKSGLGKSSLINAGLLPELEKNPYNCPVSVRFNAWTADTRDSPLSKFIAELKTEKLDTQPLDRLMSSDDSLWYYAKAHQFAQSKTRPRRLVLLFDQFEELFSYPKAQIFEFKKELSELLLPHPPERFEEMLNIATDRGQELLTPEQESQLYAPLYIRILFSIRSDRMHLLDQLSDYLPKSLYNIFELDALSEEGARAALLFPAGFAGDFESDTFEYTPEATEKIINFLKDDETEKIEAIQLQILCASFEEKVVEQKLARLGLPEIGDLNHIISNYYHHQLQKIPAVDRNAAAKLLEEGLIDKNREQRLTLHESQITDLFQVSVPVLNALVGYSLLRREPDKREGYTYELSHDTFIKPALAAREVRERAELEAQQIRQTEELAMEKRKRRWANIRALIFAVLGIGSLILGYYALGQAANGRKLENTLSNDSNAYEYLLEEGHNFLAVGDYRNALTYWANARFLKPSPMIERLVLLAKEANQAEEWFRTGELELAKKRFESFLNNNSVDLTHIQKRLVHIRTSRQVWERAIAGRKLEEIDSLTVIGDLITFPKEVNRIINLKELNIKWNKSEEIFLETFTEIPDSLMFNNVGIVQLPNLIFKAKNLSQLTIINVDRILFIQSDLGILSSLTQLNISDNDQLRTIPETIGNLSSLTHLDLIKNDQLQAIPETIGNLSNLTQFILSHNGKLDSIPETLGSLSGLIKLDLSSNSKLQAIPETIGNLSNLTQLDLSYNLQLQAVPTSIGNLKKLKIMDLRFNSEHKTLPLTLENLKENLKTIYLYETSISEEETLKWKERLPNTKIITTRW